MFSLTSTTTSTSAILLQKTGILCQAQPFHIKRNYRFILPDSLASGRDFVKGQAHNR